MDEINDIENRLPATSDVAVPAERPGFVQSVPVEIDPQTGEPIIKTAPTEPAAEPPHQVELGEEPIE